MMDRTYLGSSYAELPTPALMDAGFRCHEAIAAMSIVYAGPGPVSDAKRAAKAIERHRDDLAEIAAELRSRGIDIDDPPTTQELWAQAKENK